MPLAPGTALGPYEIVSALGAGGMGEVYRARDSRLGRDVAIKVLPEDFARDETRLRRFEQEARTASALNHPNILSIFDVGAANGVHYLVTELIEGSTLRDRLGQGALPPREVVHIGAQMADGLAAAHGAGLVHRDLKPENVMTTRDGRVKILDFGLAKLTTDTGAVDETRTALSHPGLIVGTVGYLSPEQVQAGAVDARSDLFSLGVVLHELTTGARAFQRQTTVETLSAILKEDPADLPATVPVGLERIVAHCLEKDPARRFQNAQDVAFALRSFATTTTVQAIPAEMRPPRRAFQWVAVAIAAIALLAAGAWLARTFAPPLDETPLVDLTSLRFVPFAIDEENESWGAWSPDGRSVAYVRSVNADDPNSGAQIVLRAADSSSINVLAREPGQTQQLFWMPDGSRVFYINGNTLKSVSTLGGAPRVEEARVTAADVSPDGRLLAAWKATVTEGRAETALWIGPPSAPLVPYEPAPLVVQGALVPNMIRFSPDGKRILLWVTDGPAEPLVLPVPDTGAAGGLATRLFEGQIDGFIRAAAWMPDSRRVVLQIEGSEVSLWLGDIAGNRLTRLTNFLTMAGQPSVAADGRLIFTDDRTDFGDVVTLPLSGGPPRVVVGTSRYEGYAAWSPRGGRIAYVSSRGDGDEIWTRTGNDLSDRRLLTAGDMPNPRFRELTSLIFSPDGQWLAFSGTARSGGIESRIWVVPSGGGTPRSVTPEDVRALYPSWAPDGQSLVVHVAEGGTEALWIVGLDGTQEPRPLLATDGIRRVMPEWSPTGEWIAAIDWRAGPGPTLLIRPDTGEERSLPTLGSPALVWSADGRTLYGVDTQQDIARLRALDVASGAVRTVADYGMPLQLAERRNFSLKFSLTPDGQGITTTRRTTRTDLWMITGLPR